MFFDLTAKREESQIQILLGPPRLYVLNSTVGQGIAPVTTAATLLTAAFETHDGVMQLNSTAAFFSHGMVFLEDNLGQLNGFTYEAKSGNYLVGVRRLYGTTDYYQAGSGVSQWRDITDLCGLPVNVTGQVSGSLGTWSFELKGDQWDRLIQAPDMTCLVIKRHRNSTFFDLNDPDSWGPWMVHALGYFGPVSAAGKPNTSQDSSEWNVTVFGEDYYLEQLATVPGVYGVEEVFGVDTVSSEVTDPSQVPDEGNGSVPPTAAALSDKNRNTAWRSSGTPTLDEPLLPRPVNYQVSIPPNPNWAGGLGLRIQQVYPEGYPSFQESPAVGAWIEVYNSMPEENSTPFDTAGQPTDALTWGMYDLSQYMLQFPGSILIRTGGPNGLPPLTMLGPGRGAIFCYDRKAFLARWRVPENYEVYEWRRWDGWYPGVPVGQWVRGAGSYGVLSRAGGYVAIRGTYSNNGQWRGFWEDFVAWGNITVPAQFLYKRGEEENLEQNTGGFRAQRVWINRNPSTPWLEAGTPGATVKPSGLRDGTSIRRINAMGGGVFRDDPGDNADGDFYAHDSASALDWEELAVPIIGQQAPATSVEWVERDLGEFPAATVVEDNTAFNGQITVGAGEAMEYEAALFPGETVVANGGQVEFLYDYRDQDTFYGVRKIRGNGVDVTGSELKMKVNVAIDGQAPKWRIANLYALQSIQLERWYTPPSAVAVADKTVGNALSVMPGEARRFPESGTFSIQSDPNSIKSRRVFSYTSRDDSTFYGISLVSGPSSVIRATNTLVYGDTASYPDRFKVLIAKEDTNIDALTNYGNNPGWFLANPSTTGGGNNRNWVGKVNLNGSNQRVRKFRVVIEHMSNGGQAALTSLRSFRAPRVVIGDSGAASREVMGPYTGASFCRDILLNAGVEPYRIKATGGRPILNDQVSAGNVKEALDKAAQKHGLVINIDKTGLFYIFDDPRIGSTGWTQVPKGIFTPDAITPNYSIQPQPRHQVSRVEVTGYNDLTQEIWTVQYPFTPNGLGSVRRYPARPALDWNDLVMQAKLLWLASNGGAAISIEWGQQDNFQLFDIVPLRAVIEQSGVLYGQSDMMLTRISYKHDDRRAWSSGTGLEMRGI